MENKPQNVFEKLDKQEEKIDDISSKLEGINIEDLYALAKRTWDYDDYKTAQKYYNHISLLRPLDWEAPLYASLCNFKGSHQVDFWEYGLNHAAKVLVSTINYINNLNRPFDDKNNEMAKCIDILKDFMLIMKDMYFKNKEIFDVHIPDFVCKLEAFYFDVYNKTASIELDSLCPFRVFMADNILGLIKNTKKITPDITKEVFEKLIQILGKDDVDYEFFNLLNKIETTKELSNDEKNEIMLNGTMYFEYNDKVISKRNFNRNLILGIILSIIAIVGIVISFLGKWYWMFVFIFSLFYGVMLVAKALTEKDKIKCLSLLSSHRIKNRLTSNGSISQDDKFNFLRFFTTLDLELVMVLGIIMALLSLFGKEVSTYAVVFVVIVALNIILHCISFKGLCKWPSFREGKYYYLYNGKYYNIK